MSLLLYKVQSKLEIVSLEFTWRLNDYGLVVAAFELNRIRGGCGVSAQVTRLVDTGRFGEA